MVIVRNLNLIVELCALFNHGVFQCTTVHRCACANFDIVTDNDATHLRNLDPFAIKGGKAKAVPANHAARLEDTTVTHLRFALNHNIGVH